MITKEEYKKTLIRMWDSLREDDEYMGKSSCEGVRCSRCPLYHNDNVCVSKVYNACEIISIVEEWGKEHPIKTNGSRFLENYPTADVCGYRDNGKILFIRLDNSKPSNAEGNCIEVPAEWWEKEVE
jgi:hypothetical protein